MAGVKYSMLSLLPKDRVRCFMLVSFLSILILIISCHPWLRNCRDVYIHTYVSWSMSHLNHLKNLINFSLFFYNCYHFVKKTSVELMFTFIKFLGWTGVATWRWVANDDNCGICRMPFDGCCPDCKLPGDDCPLGIHFDYLCISVVEFNLLNRIQFNAKIPFVFHSVWGQCSHCFHIHCIMKWLNSQQVNHQCPMCRQEWKFKE